METPQPNNDPSAFTQPDIIIKFREGGILTETDGKLEAEHLKFEKFREVINDLQGVRVEQSFKFDSKYLEELRLAPTQKDEMLPSLDLFVRLKFENQVEDIENLLDKLRQDHLEIEHVSLAGIPGPSPQTPVATLDFSGLEKHLLPAPDGINAGYAWGFSTGNATSKKICEGIKICDCEYGFNQNHEELGTITVISNHGGSLTTDANHGTNVLGVLAPNDGGFGVTGISQGASILFASAAGGNRTQCILDAINSLKKAENEIAGNVLLLEMQTYLPKSNDNILVPAEYDADVYAAVQDAASKGICVVAAAGNGGIDLSTVDHDVNGKIWGDPSCYSKSIIVGAGISEKGIYLHGKTDASNYGPRVNCQGWGENVVTTGKTGDKGDLQNITNAEYTAKFNGTSSASAIIAGVVACIQGAVKRDTRTPETPEGTPLSPDKIRSLLSNPDLGTPQVSTKLYDKDEFPIGPLPDLKAILQDVYMRDNKGDTGREPNPARWTASSPDIIPLNDRVYYKDKEFGEESGNRNLDGLGNEIINDGNDKYIYVRALNKGILTDHGATISLYWSPVDTFITPSEWKKNFIGSDVIKVPSENRLAVGEVIWPASKLPPHTGHFCFIGIINGTNDTIDIPSSFSTDKEYISFVLNNNNVVHRNFNVVPINSLGAIAKTGGTENAHADFSEPAENEIALQFFVTGAEFGDLEMRLEVGGLPQRATIHFEADRDFLQNMLGDNLRVSDTGKDSNSRIIRAPLDFPQADNAPIQSFRLQENVFRKDLREPASLIVGLPENLRTQPYDIFIRQLRKDVEVGRITWRLVPYKEEPKQL